jgi:hypothetical protein
MDARHQIRFGAWHPAREAAGCLASVSARTAVACVSHGLSLSEYLLRDLERRARRPDPDEVIQRILRRPRAQGVKSPTETIRELRDSS